MTSFTTRRIIVLAVLLVGASGQGARAQSDADLRRENQRLATQVSDTRRELEAAKNLIDQLQQEIVMLRGLLATERSSESEPPVPVEEEVSIDESIPLASPRAMLRSLQQRYQEVMQDHNVGDPAALDDQRERASLMRDLNRWARRMNREMKSPIQWHVRIARVASRGHRSHLEVHAVDPKTGAILGDPFPVVVPMATMRRLRELEQRTALDVLVLKGVVIPRVEINADRFEQGQFDNPRFVGPYAEFSMSVEASSLTPVPAPQDDAQKQPPRRPSGRS